MWYRRTSLLAAAALVVVLAVRASDRARNPEAPAKSPVKTDPAKKPGQDQQQFIRLNRDADRRPLALESAIVTYVPEDCSRTSPTVDLIAAVHVGEKSYYDELNRRFAQYDVVLYELVAPEGTRIPKGARPDSKHPISFLQTGMSKVLKLEFQLSCVDYTKQNLVHADLSPQQLAEAMQKRGESAWTIFARIMGHALVRQGFRDDVGSAKLLLALLDKNRSLALKRLMAEELQDMEGTLTMIEGPKGSALISDRNKAALEVLRKQIAAGKKKIAIFYGAGHMSGFHRQLHDDFGLEPVATRWLVAWDLKGDGKGSK